MILDVRFSNGIILPEYKVKSIIRDGEWLTLIEENEAITNINLNNVDIYSIYEEGPGKENE